MPEQKFIGKCEGLPEGLSSLSDVFKKGNEMKKYLGVKLIQAEQKSQDQFAGAKNKGDLSKLNGGIDRDGYKVVYEDGYTSWSPKEVFEKAYRPTTGLNFGLAVEALKMGKKVARKGWGTSTMVSYVEPHNKHWFDPYIGIKGGDVGYIPWLASHEDILADDWQIV